MTYKVGKHVERDHFSWAVYDESGEVIELFETEEEAKEKVKVLEEEKHEGKEDNV